MTKSSPHCFEDQTRNTNPQVIPSEVLEISKNRLKKIFSLVERINIDIHSDDKARQGAAAIMIHVITKACTGQYEDKLLNNGDSND